MLDYLGFLKFSFEALLAVGQQKSDKTNTKLSKEQTNKLVRFEVDSKGATCAIVSKN